MPKFKVYINIGWTIQAKDKAEAVSLFNEMYDDYMISDEYTFAEPTVEKIK